MDAGQGVDVAGAQAGDAGAGGRLRTALHRGVVATRDLLSNRGVMLVAMEISLLLYTWRAPATIDFPEYDEADYFFRGFQLAHGNVAGAILTDPGRNPLYVVYYAVWYLALHTANLYPWILTSSILLLGLGAYLLLARVFHPLLSWALAILIVAWSVPYAPNGVYVFATACLWLSLAVLGKPVWRRGLGAALVVLCVLVRPDFVTAAGMLVVLLALYEWRVARRERTPWRALATAYAPVCMFCLLGAYLYVASPQGYQGASTYSLEWSYTDFYRVNYPAQFSPIYSYANPSQLFEKDFGPLPQTASFTAALAAMGRNPAMLRQYLGFESSRLVASFGTATLDLPQWHYDHTYTQPIAITRQDTLLFGGCVLAYLAVAGGCYLALRRRGIRVLPDLSDHAPVLLGYLSLAALLPLMVLVNPHQRFFMLYPLVLLPMGFGLLCIGRAAQVALRGRLPRWERAATAPAAQLALMLCVALAVLRATPQPFAQEPPSDHYILQTLTFLDKHVPAGSTLIAQPGTSFAEYLTASGYPLTGVDGAGFGAGGNVIANVLSAEPGRDRVYVLFNDNIPYGLDNPWFTAWKQLYPAIPITPVASMQNPYLALYRLPDHLAARVSYLDLQRLVEQGSVPSVPLPSYNSIDFTVQPIWQGDDPRNQVTPIPWQVYGWDTSAITMYPDLPGVWAIRAHVVTTPLPVAWSGRTLVFAGAFAPWELGQPGADGTQLVFTVAGTQYLQVVQFPNESPEHWIPIVVHLPAYAAPTSLAVTVLPRTSQLWDDTLLSFVGLSTGGAGTVPQVGPAGGP